VALKKECSKCHYKNPRSAKKCRKCQNDLSGKVTWWVDLNTSEGRIRKRIGPDRQAAEAYELALKQKRVRKKVFGEIDEIEPITLEELWPKYAAWCKVNNESFETKVYRWKKLRPIFGKRLLNQITLRLVEQYRLSRLQEGVSAATVNKEITMLKHMLNKAIEWGYLKENPIARVKPLKEKRRKWRYLTPEEFVRIFQNIHPLYRDLLVFLTFTGLRRGEALGLTWQDVDPERGVIVIWAGKTGETRFVHLNSVALRVLRKRYSSRNGEEESSPIAHASSAWLSKRLYRKPGFPKRYGYTT